MNRIYENHESYVLKIRTTKRVRFGGNVRIASKEWSGPNSICPLTFKFELYYRNKFSARMHKWGKRIKFDEYTWNAKCERQSKGAKDE